MNKNAYAISPFNNYEIKNKRLTEGKRYKHTFSAAVAFADLATGEVISSMAPKDSSIVSLQGQYYDADHKISILRDSLKSLIDHNLLSPVLGAIFYAASGSKTDHCAPNFEGIPQTSLRRGLKTLKQIGWIADHPNKGRYWINPGAFFGFNRVKHRDKLRGKRAKMPAEQVANEAIEMARKSHNWQNPAANSSNLDPWVL